MKKRNYLIVIIIVLTLLGLSFLILTFSRPKFYTMHVDLTNADKEKFEGVLNEGIIVDGFWQKAFMLSIDYTHNPNDRSSYKYGIYIGNDSNRKLIVGYSNWNYIEKIEKTWSKDNDNITNKLLKNNDNVYFCFYDKNITIDYENIQEKDSCFKIIIEKSN